MPNSTFLQFSSLWAENCYLSHQKLKRIWQVDTDPTANAILFLSSEKKILISKIKLEKQFEPCCYLPCPNLLSNSEIPTFFSHLSFSSSVSNRTESAESCLHCHSVFGFQFYPPKKLLRPIHNFFFQKIFRSSYKYGKLCIMWNYHGPSKLNIRTFMRYY